MTVSSTTNTASYLGNGTTQAFAIPFYFQEMTDLLVQTYNPTTLVTTTLVLNVDYTITPTPQPDPNFGWPNGGTLNTTVPVPTGTDLFIYRQVPALQPLALPVSGPFPSQPIEADLDRIVMAIQDEETFSNNLAVTIPLALESIFNRMLPAAIGQAGSAGAAIVVNSTSNGFALSPVTPSPAGTPTWQDFVTVDFAMSPFTIQSIPGRSTFYLVDTTGGNVVINLPQVSGLDLTSPYNVAIKKVDSTANMATINSFSGDTIDGASSATLSSQNQSIILAADAPTFWVSTGVSNISLPASLVPASNSGHNYLTGNTVQAQLDEADTALGKIPAVTILTTASGTYTVPTGTKYLRVRMVGAGGGGGGGGSSASGSTAGSATTFGTSLLVANGGNPGSLNNPGGLGGTAALGSGPVGLALTGNSGNSGDQNPGSAANKLGGGNGGASFFLGSGLGGWAANNGSNAAANSGSGGGGGGIGPTANDYSGPGGGSGGYVDAIISGSTLTATFAYTVGIGGSGETGSVTNGGNGANGQIIVEAY